MAKYHINPETGNPGVCRAKVQCKFGGSAAHYSSKEEARDAYEVTQEALKSFNSSSSKVTGDGLPENWDYDLEELSVIARMRKVLMVKHGWEAEDFEGMSFLDVESAFLDDYEEEDFRPPGD